MEDTFEWSKHGTRKFSGIRVSQSGDNREFGGFYDKHKVDVSLGEHGKVRLLVKNVPSGTLNGLFNWEDDDESAAERYFKRWKKIKQIGIPTVRSLRIVGKAQVGMVDMTSDGSQFFDKHYFQKIYDEVVSGKTRELTEMEKKFLTVEPSLIKREIARNLESAWAKGIILPDDDEEYSVYLRPSGEWTVMVADLSYLGPRKNTDTEGWLANKTEQLCERFDNQRKELLALASPNLTADEKRRLAWFQEETA